MTNRVWLAVGGGVLVLALVLAGLAFLMRTPTPASDEPAAAREPAAPPPASIPAAHITATLFYASDDGRGLVPVRRDVPLAEGVVAQGGQILRAQLEPAPAPYVSVIPEGTTLRAFYVTENGEAFVDLSREIATAHPGGSLTELLTVYAVVHAVTANLPAVQRVQLLVDGREVDTIAGHVDVRRPLTADTSLIRQDPAR